MSDTSTHNPFMSILQEDFNSVGQLSVPSNPLAVAQRKRSLTALGEDESGIDIDAETSDFNPNYYETIKDIVSRYESNPDIQMDAEGNMSVRITSKLGLGDFLDELDNHPAVEDVEIWNEEETLSDASTAIDNDDEGIDLDDVSDNASFIVDIYVKPEYAIYDAEFEDEMKENLRYDESGLYDDSEAIMEVKRKWKVNSKGARRIKMKCKPGFRWNGKSCIKISGSELSVKRKATRQMLRTKKAQGEGLKRRVKRKTAKARRFRKSFGLK